MPTRKYQYRIIFRKSKTEHGLISIETNREMSTHHGFKASKNILQICLDALGPNRRCAVAKLLKFLKNRNAIVDFAKRHIGWTSNEGRDVIFYNEFKFLRL